MSDTKTRLLAALIENQRLQRELADIEDDERTERHVELIEGRNLALTKRILALKGGAK